MCLNDASRDVTLNLKKIKHMLFLEYKREKKKLTFIFLVSLIYFSKCFPTVFEVMTIQSTSNSSDHNQFYLPVYAFKLSSHVLVNLGGQLKRNYNDLQFQPIY